MTRVAGENKPHEQIDEVRSGGSYISQNDLRIHFGLGPAEKVELIEVRWPSGLVERFDGLPADGIRTVKEGTGAKAN